MTDYAQEQEMEIEALEAILMEDFKEIHSGESGFNSSNKCYQITVSPMEDDADELTIPVQLGLIFSHTERYPDEPPLLNLKSLRGIQVEHLRTLKEKLLQEASENLGMAMIYTLVSSAKEWLFEKYAQDTSIEDAIAAEAAAKDDIIIPHGEPVTFESFLAWREMFEAELALERAKLMPESVLSAPKEKRLTGRQWFESGRASAKGAAPATEGSDDEDDEDIDFDDEDFEDDEDDMLEHYLATETPDSSTHSSRRAAN